MTKLDPDRERGLFETVLVVDGVPLRLDAHLARMATSLAAVYDGAELPPAVRADALAAAHGLALARMRIDVAPAGEGFRHQVGTTALDPATFFPDRADGADLRAVEQPAWAGAHKLADRDWLESVEAELGEAVPLIVAGTEVLEAGRASVFVVRGEGLATPPLDGRILPGTARASLLELAGELGVAVAEEPLTLADLGAAEEVFLTSSLRGIRPARSLDGEALGQGSELMPRLQEALRARWLGEDEAEAGS